MDFRLFRNDYQIINNIKKRFIDNFLNQSGERGSNPQPSAWKAEALPVELSPQ